MKTAFVTGASGFVGAAVCRALLSAGWSVTGQVCRHVAPPGVLPQPLDLSRMVDWSCLGERVDAVIHLAGLAHVPPGDVSREGVWRINVAPVGPLADAAASAGARFLYVSSAKVLGESGEWDDSARAAPADLYAESKLAAEEIVAATAGLSWTILRPPLVYGPEVKGNFLRLLHLANAGWPLPLATLRAPRSYLYVENLVSAVLACLQSPAADGQRWLVSDSEAIALPQLLRHLTAGLGRPARLLPFPPRLLEAAARVCGRQADYSRLAGRFVIHDEGLRATLAWTPPYSLQAGLAATTAWFRASGPATD